MLIHKISVDNFMARGACELELPEAGITVLTGANGAGKSRFIEAVAYAYWGETLRGEGPWIDGEAGSVSVLSASGDVTRKVTKGGSKSVLWNGSKADTPSRTVELIKAAIPEFDFWKRTHVFSSGEAAHFSGATDGERKRIMEMLLGMEVFDRAQRACLDETGQANAAVQLAAVEVAKAEGRLNVAIAKLTALGEYPAFRPGVPPVVQEAPAVGRAQTIQGEIDVLQQRRTEEIRRTVTLPPQTTAEYVALKEELRDAERRLALARAGRCDACGQPYHGVTVQELEQQCGELDWVLKAHEEQAREARDAAVRAATHAKLEVARLDRELARKQAELQAAKDTDAAFIRATHELERWEAAEAGHLAAWERGKAAHEVKRERARAEAMMQEDDLADFRIELESCQARVAELQVAATILGVRGLRGHVLGRALDGVEAVANYWLQQIAPGRALTVRSEGDAGKIVIGLHGFGGGKYKASSAGERRRVDAPLLLALAEVAGHGRARGTLFLDEVFDALDRDGRALVCRALGELGQTQSVVVVTHQEDLARSIPAVQRFEVSAGTLRAI
jgi:DNA repair exonuclease SbcCD ATPase subunit